MKTFLAVFNAFPAILQAVQAVELAVPIPGAGQQKLNLILGAGAVAWEVSQHQQQFSKNDTMNAVQAMINLAVAALNTTGAWKRVTPVSSK